jgi:nitroreductase
MTENGTADGTVTLLDGLGTARSIRRYHLDEDIPEDDISRLLFLATRAPNPGNQQNWRFIVLRRDATKIRQMLGEAYRDGWREQRVSYGYDRLPPDQNSPKMRVGKTMDAFVGGFERIPLIIMACVAGVRETAYLGGAPAIFPACQNLLLAARAMGYGGVLTTWHRRIEADVRRELGIPADTLIAATIPLGRPMGHFGRMRRKPLHDCVFVGKWGEQADWVKEP